MDENNKSGVNKFSCTSCSKLYINQTIRSSNVFLNTKDLLLMPHNRRTINLKIIWTKYSSKIMNLELICKKPKTN